MLKNYIILKLFLLLLLFENKIVASNVWNPVEPPPPAWGVESHMLQRNNNIEFEFWTKDSDTNIWEHSGLFEGDIMLHRSLIRNGLLNEKTLWTDGVVPFYIDSKDFKKEQMVKILKGFKDFHEKTCIRFRPYEKGDEHWINIKGNYSGCWSLVGRRQGGQILNLNAKKCVYHNVIVHELLHALGFYHQQSATERDDYIKINWENIREGQVRNFNKYARTHISSYGVDYDYYSIMHYSALAFSKNGLPTIEPLDPKVTLGKRNGMSKKDRQKLNEMYDQECNGSAFTDGDQLGLYLNIFIDYFQDNISNVFGGVFSKSDHNTSTTNNRQLTTNDNKN